MFGLVDILIIIAILAYGLFCVWVIYRLMKSADANEENEENEEQESEKIKKGDKKMGYRLHASIPNIEYADNDLELGKQYNVRWNDFNNRYFGKGADEGILLPSMFDEFLSDLKMTNSEIIENKESYDLYNIELLEKMFEFAKENDYYVYFVSK